MTVRRGELIAAVSAVALFTVMFLNWYGFEPVAPGAEASPDDPALPVEGFGDVTAWERFDVIDLGLVAVIVITVALVARSALRPSSRLPIAGSAIIAAVGIASTLVILLRAIYHPDVGLDIEETTKIGAYLGVLACAGIAAGGLIAMRDEGTSFGAEVARLGGAFGGGEPPRGEDEAPPGGDEPPLGGDEPPRGGP